MRPVHRVKKQRERYVIAQLPFSVFLFKAFCLCVCVCIGTRVHMFMETSRDFGSFAAEVISGCELPDMEADNQLVFLQEQQVLVNADPFLQLSFFLLLLFLLLLILLLCLLLLLLLLLFLLPLFLFILFFLFLSFIHGCSFVGWCRPQSGCVFGAHLALSGITLTDTPGHV